MKEKKRRRKNNNNSITIFIIKYKKASLIKQKKYMQMLKNKTQSALFDQLVINLFNEMVPA